MLAAIGLLFKGSAVPALWMIQYATADQLGTLTKKCPNPELQFDASLWMKVKWSSAAS